MLFLHSLSSTDLVHFTRCFFEFFLFVFFMIPFRADADGGSGVAAAAAVRLNRRPKNNVNVMTKHNTISELDNENVDMLYNVWMSTES